MPEIEFSLQGSVTEALTEGRSVTVVKLKVNGKSHKITLQMVND